jgi:hypothetical protein
LVAIKHINQRQVYLSISQKDFRALRKLRDAAGSRFKAGVVLYDGELCASFGEGMFAVPIRCLWETP